MQLTEQTGNTAISSVIAFNPTITRVEVGPGTYDEDATLAIPAGVTVVATAGPSQTFIRDINATGTGGDVTLATGDVLDGFTVSKGVTVNIYATIQNCVLSTTVAGGAVVNIAGGTGTTTLAPTLTPTPEPTDTPVATDTPVSTPTPTPTESVEEATATPTTEATPVSPVTPSPTATLSSSSDP